MENIIEWISTTPPQVTAHALSNSMTKEKQAVKASRSKRNNRPLTLSLLDSSIEAPAASVIVPAGTYIIGDPCYTIQDVESEWMDALESSNYFSNPIGICRSQNVYGFHTFRGDGLYLGNDGFTYCVDSGIIGLVPVEFGTHAVARGLCKIAVFHTNTRCTSSNGVLKFGRTSINTRK